MTGAIPSDALTETERLVIRPWRPGESERFFDMHRRWEVARWISGRAMTDRAEGDRYIARYAQQLEADPRFGYWAVVERGAGRPAGTVILKALPNGDGEIEIGWHLHPDSWGRGLATEAARAVMGHGFACGLGEIWAVTDPANHASANVCRKLGMRLLGVTRRWYGSCDLMFHRPARAGMAPSLAPDGPAPGASG